MESWKVGTSLDKSIQWHQKGSVSELYDASCVYSLTSVCIFSILFSIYFLAYKKNFFKQSEASLVDDHFFDSLDLNV